LNNIKINFNNSLNKLKIQINNYNRIHLIKELAKIMINKNNNNYNNNTHNNSYKNNHCNNKIKLISSKFKIEVRMIKILRLNNINNF
jgi:hypothetical protein